MSLHKEQLDGGRQPWYKRPRAGVRKWCRNQFVRFQRRRMKNPDNEPTFGRYHKWEL